MMRKFCVFLLVCCIFPLMNAKAQPPERLIEPRSQALIYAGPGYTYLAINQLAWQDDIEVIARNPVGNWLQVHIERGNAGTEIDGWVQTGYLILDESIQFSAVPINNVMPDAAPENVNSQTLAALYSVPVVPTEISDAVREVFAQGQERGNHADVLTKVGDSISTSPVFIGAMSLAERRLGPYDYLADTIEFFADSADEPSIASRVGMSTYALFDSMWADPDQCEAGETPLACEYRLKQPSVAVVVFGPNDVRSMDKTQYAVQMRLIVEESFAHGVIPILSTFSVDPDEELWWQAINLNLAVAAVAAEYEVPLINFWAASRSLPAYGLDEDAIHPMHSGFPNLVYDTGHEVYYGVSLQNLLTLYVLDLLYEELPLFD